MLEGVHAVEETADAWLFRWNLENINKVCEQDEPRVSVECLSNDLLAVRKHFPVSWLFNLSYIMLRTYFLVR